MGPGSREVVPGETLETGRAVGGERWGQMGEGDRVALECWDPLRTTGSLFHPPPPPGGARTLRDSGGFEGTAGGAAGGRSRALCSAS